MKQPKLRFKADDGNQYPEWEEKRLEEVAVRITRKNKDNCTDIPLTISSLDGLIDQRDFFNKIVASKDMSGYYLLKRGEFAYNKSYSKGFDFGSIKRLNLYDEGALSTLYICFALNDNEDSDFYQKYFDSLSWYPELQKICAEGARNHGLLNVSTNDFFQLKLHVPKSKEEQQEIASFFTELDNLIQSAQKELDGYRELKQGMLQKMFPKKGEKVPEIRFPEFTGDWEQRKLEQVAKYRNGKAHENEIDESGDYIVVNSKFVSTNGEVKKYSASQIEPLFENEIAFVLSDVPNGRAIARTFLVNESGKYTLNQRIAGITPLDKTYPYFLHIVMNRNPYFLKFDDGVKQTNLSLNDVLNFKEYYPEYDEQKKIGDYFTSLDNLIILQQKELDGYKELKKGLLQQMFC